MTQKEFDDKIEKMFKNEPDPIKRMKIEYYVIHTMNLCVSHPGLAMDYFDRQPRAVMD